MKNLLLAGISCPRETTSRKLAAAVVREEMKKIVTFKYYSNRKSGTEIRLYNLCKVNFPTVSKAKPYFVFASIFKNTQIGSSH